MKIQIQSIDFNARQSLLQLIKNKLEKLGRLSDDVLEAKVILRLDHSDTQNNKVCEIRLVVPGNDLFVKKLGCSFDETIGCTIDALQRQVTERKTKLTDRKLHHSKRSENFS